MKFTRVWAMPNADTFSVKPIGEFVQRYLAASKVSVDPFARNKRWATHTNDLNPETAAEHHMDAQAFLEHLKAGGGLWLILSSSARPTRPGKSVSAISRLGARWG